MDRMKQRFFEWARAEARKWHNPLAEDFVWNELDDYNTVFGIEEALSEVADVLWAIGEPVPVEWREFVRQGPKSTKRLVQIERDDSNGLATLLLNGETSILSLKEFGNFLKRILDAIDEMDAREEHE